MIIGDDAHHDGDFGYFSYTDTSWRTGLEFQNFYAGIVPATPNHVGAIYDIECQSFADPWTKDSILYEITHEQAICYVAVNSYGDVLGYVTMRHVIDEGQICNIAVAKQHQRKGIGSLLIEASCAEARRRKMIGLTLEVRVSNQPAIALYEKYGFAAEGIRKDFYSNPDEDGLIMWMYTGQPVAPGKECNTFNE